MAGGEAAPLLTPGSTPARTRWSAIIAVSVAFFMLFLAFNSLQNYATSLLPGSLGSESLSVLYVSVCVFVFTAPHIAKRLGEKRTMVLGSVSYLIYMGSTIHPIRAIVLIAAVIIGFGAAILWVSVGSYITKASHPSELGRTNGMFWGIFQASGIVGNLFAYFIFEHLDGSASFFLALTAAGGVGVLILFFIPSEKTTIGTREGDDEANEGPEPSVNDVAPATPAEHLTVWQEVQKVFDILLTNRLLALGYLIIFTGLEMAFRSGEFPQLLPQKSIGMVLAFAGLGEVVGALGLSSLSDRVGCTALLWLASLTHAASMVLAIMLKNSGLPGPGPEWLGVSWIAYMASFGFGLSDALFNTQCYALIGKMFAPEHAVRAFTGFQLFQNIGSAGGYYLGVPLPMHGDKGSLGQVWIQLFLLVTGTLLYTWADLRYGRRPPTTPDVRHEIDGASLDPHPTNTSFSA